MVPEEEDKVERLRTREGWRTIQEITMNSNHRYASILFDTGADRSFVSTAFSSLIDIAPSALDTKYDVELADGKIIGVDTIIWGWESSSSAAVAGESVLKADDALSTQLSNDLPPVTAFKAGEFNPGISTAALKRLSVQSKKSLVPKKPLSKKGQLVIDPPMSVMGESTVGSSHRAADDLCSSEAGSKRLVSRGSSMTLNSLCSALIHSESLVTGRLGSRYALVPHHIPEIVFDLGPLCRSFIDHLATLGQFSCLRLEHAKLVKGKLERRLAHRDVALEKRDAEIEHVRKLLNVKPSGEIAHLSLGFEGAEREVGCLRKQVEELKAEAGKQLELRNASLQGQVDGEIEVKFEFAGLLDNQQRRFDERVVALDARHDKMVKEIDEEFAPMLRDTRETKRIEACAEQPFSYVEALLVMGVRESIQDEPDTSTNPTSGSTSFAGGVMKQFIIPLSVPYVVDAGATAKDVTPWMK
ncbi:putative reverse transcriptase domain-containing protein [Tanacetum coccineum]